MFSDNKCSKQFSRAEQMIFADKFNLHSEEFCAELNKLVARFMDFDSLVVQFTRGSNNLLISVSVKKVKPCLRVKA